MVGALVDETGVCLFGVAGREKSTLVDNLLVSVDDEAGKNLEHVAAIAELAASDCSRWNAQR